ncbi:UNVERIFIED_CONTAM: hypothetical protein GTU68_036061 [Idotea baltica]|nr:hypothetical protein [Idotea baltica]
MTSKAVVAIAGATGVVGSEIISILEARKFPIKELRIYASKDSLGEVYKFNDEEVVVQVLDKSSFEGVDIALFATSASLSEKFVPFAVNSGAFVIDNSSFFRMQDGIPLVVPEVNSDILTKNDKIIANPNCSTIQLIPILNTLQNKLALKRVVVSTYQSVSGAGKTAIDELWNQTKSIFTQQELKTEAFAHQIAFNCIPQIDVILDNGYTKEEYKIINESRKILNLPKLKITATAVRVPVFNSHAESVNIELKSESSVDEINKLLSETEGVRVFNNFSEYPMQINSSGKDDIFVGRVRKDESAKNTFDLWIVADNLRKGAALNAVQIAEVLIKKFIN